MSAIMDIPAFYQESESPAVYKVSLVKIKWPDVALKSNCN